MLNKIIVQGRLVKDVEIRHTQSGKEVASVTLACERDFKKNGEKETDWIDVVAWGNTSSFLGKYFSKGRMAVVEGRLQTRTFEDKDGNKRKVTEIVADNVYFGDSKKDADPLDTFTRNHPDTVVAKQFEEISDDDGDLPF